MKTKARLFSAFVIAGCLLFLPASKGEAQVFVGAHGSVGDVGGTAFGIGARVGVVLYGSDDLTVVMEGVGEYLFPSCDVVDCDVISLQGNVLARRRVASYAEAYAGLGFAYQDFDLEDNETGFAGDDAGFSLLVGTQSGQPGNIRPFLEVRYTFMGDLDNQAAVSLGIRVPLG